MLMSVLKGDLAIQQSMALIRLFKKMKDCNFCILLQTPEKVVLRIAIRASGAVLFLQKGVK